MSQYQDLLNDELMPEAASPPEGEPRPEAQSAEDPATVELRTRFESLLREREAAHAREITEKERKAAEWERSYKAALRDLELATALAGRPLVPGAASQLIKLWRDDFDVYEEQGVLKVASRDGRAIVQAVAERLAGSEYAHFCQPTSRGGTAQSGPTRTANAGPAVSVPRTLGEAAILRWREGADRQAEGTGAPIGLHPRRR
jgi:hypothetical protein